MVQCSFRKGCDMKIEVIEGVVRPQVEGGSDWGVEREVLVRLVEKVGPVKELWWQGGCRYWSGIGSQSYAKANLSLASPSSWANMRTVGGSGTNCVELHEGRFSKAMLKQHAEKINDFFGADVAGLIQRGKTVVVTKG